MPYATTALLPASVKAKLKGKKRRQWMHVFNSAFARHKAESIAFAEAWATVKNADGFGRKAYVGKATQMSDFQFFMPIAKVEKNADGTCVVSGYASTPTEDADGEIVTLKAIKNALPGYMEWRNIREMHQLKAVGKAQQANIDDKGLWLQALISDPVAVKKCVDEVYQGFSIGGKKLSMSGNKITAIDMNEISIVDRPANPDAKFDLAKSIKDADASKAGGYLLKAAPKRTPESKALAKMAKIVEGLAKNGPPAAHDGFSLPAKPAVEKVEDNKEACKAHGTVGCDKCAAAKAAGKSPCEAHGAFDCDKCATKVADPPTAVPKKKTKSERTVKKLAKAKLDAAFGLASDSFLTLRKRQSDLPSGLDLKKGMGTAGSLSYCFDSVRSAQRSLLMEAKREGGDMKDKALAEKLGTIAKELAGVISQKAEHEGEEALDLSDGDDTYVTTLFGEELKMATVSNNNLGGTGDALTDAMAALMKRASVPTRAQRMSSASDNIKKARKAAKAARSAIEEAHKMHKAAYMAKTAKKDPKKDDDEEFDHAGAMEKLQKAYQEIDKARTFSKAASVQMAKAAGRSGQRGQETGDPEAGFYEVPAGVKDLSPAALAGAAPGTSGGTGLPPMYPDDGSVYAGKAAGGTDLRKYVKNGLISADVAELLMQKSQQEGELEALRRIPAGAAGGRRPYAFDMTKVMGGDSTGRGADNATINKALFEGVNANDLNSDDERARTAASARVAGNFLLSGHFAKNVFDPAYNGAVGTK